MPIATSSLPWQRSVATKTLSPAADEALRPGVVTDPNPSIEEDIPARRLLALGEYAPPATVAAGRMLLKRYPQNLAAVNVQGAALLADGKVEEADRVTQVLRQNPDGARMEATYHDTLARIDAAMGRMEDAYANYEAALNLDASLSKTYARKLSELGFLPLSNAPAGVLTAAASLHRRQEDRLRDVELKRAPVTDARHSPSAPAFRLRGPRPG